MESKGKVITVKTGSFFVNREDPTQVSYNFVDTTKWKPVQLGTYINTPPDPRHTQVMYVLEGNPLRAAYELL